MKKIEDDWILVKGHKDYEKYFGYQLTSVNGIQFQEVRNKIRGFISAENS